MKRREYTLIARAYAQALFNAATSQNTVDAVQREARDLARALARSPKLGVFLQSPQIPSESKMALIEKVYGARLSPILLKLLTLLVRRERTRHLPEILALADELIDHSHGIWPAGLASGKPLNDADRARLLAALERYTGSKLRMEWSVEPSLIGGIVFRFRDLLIDGSIREGLEELRRNLLGTTLARN